MPGLTSRIFAKACQEAGLKPDAKIIGTTDEQWNSVEELCRTRLELPINWKDIQYDQTVKRLLKKDKQSAYAIGYKPKFKDELEVKKKIFKEIVDDNLSLF